MGNVSLILFLFSLSISAHAGGDYRYRFTAHDALGTEETAEAQRAAEQISELLEPWSWGKRVTGQWEFRFAPATSVLHVPAGREAAAGLNGENQSLLVMIWDVIKSGTEFPNIAAFEHVAAHVYRVMHMGLDPFTNFALAERLQLEGVYLALLDLAASPAYAKLTPAERGKVDADLAEYFAEVGHGLTAEQLKHLNCAENIRGKLQ